MEIRTTSILVNDNGKEIKEGDVLSMTVGKKSIIGKFVGIKSAGMLAFQNPITGESFNIRLSSIGEAKLCTFSITED